MIKYIISGILIAWALIWLANCFTNWEIFYLDFWNWTFRERSGFLTVLVLGGVVGSYAGAMMKIFWMDYK